MASQNLHLTLEQKAFLHEEFSVSHELLDYYSEQCVSVPILCPLQRHVLFSQLVSVSDMISSLGEMERQKSLEETLSGVIPTPAGKGH